MKLPSSVKREHSRRLATQALYKHHFDPLRPEAIIREFRAAPSYDDCDKAYFMALVRGTIKELTLLDERIAPLLDRELRALDPIEHALLLIGAFELFSMKDTPARVVIDQGVRLAKQFGATGSHAYINAVLDQIAHQERQDEFSNQDTPCLTSSN